VIYASPVKHVADIKEALKQKNANLANQKVSSIGKNFLYPAKGRHHGLRV